MAGGKLRVAEDGRLSDHSLRGPWRCWQHRPVITFLYHSLALLSWCFQLSDSVSNSNQAVSTLQATRSGLLHPGNALVFIVSASFKILNSFLSQSHCSLVRIGYMLVSLCLSFSRLRSIFLSNVLPLSGFLFLTRTHRQAGTECISLYFPWYLQYILLH